MCYNQGMKTHVLSVVVGAGLAYAGFAASPFSAVQKKYIGHGWDLLGMTPREVLAHADAFDKTGLDGVTLVINATLADGRAISHTRIMNDPPWPRDRLKDQIAVFKDIVKHPSLRESFITSFWAPVKRLAWTDDAAWANFAANMATVAWLAKEGGLRGILVDAEDYPRSRQYNVMPGDPAYDETAALARRRGAEVFRAIFAEYPDVTFLSFWLLSQNTSYFAVPEPIAAAKAKGDLWPWFVNGMLDVIPPTARFVDGNEHAYRYEAEKGAFYRSACEQRTGALGLVAPENRPKYLAQLRAGFGLYLDAYINPANSPWYFGPVDGSRLNHYHRNLEQATAAADEYVWVYGEQKAWVKWAGTKSDFNGRETWDEALPGLDDMMLGVRDPVRLLRQRTAALRAAGKLVNLAKVSDVPWRDDKQAQGEYGREGGAVFLKGVGNGCYVVEVEGRPGDLFGIRFKYKGAGGSSTVYWQKDRKWQWHLPGVPVPIEGGAANEWHEGGAAIRIPEGANRLGLQLSANQRPGEICWFDAVEIYKLTGK